MHVLSTFGDTKIIVAAGDLVSIYVNVRVIVELMNMIVVP